ncbi:segregation/condensation protein A [bacterium]|nr:segregation/condensation protein A [bacterium]|tara:strand:- start:2123 stop:2857 length:735 start_codon:yes stop_codon:yes gene_type:complete
MDNFSKDNVSTYSLKLDIFEGPLDLLLTLIKEKDLDIYEISLAEVTQQYLEYVDLLQEINFQNIADYLVIAAELTRIKSRSLLPQDEAEEEIENENDIDLVEMLKEYKKYRLLSDDLNKRKILGRDTFKRFQNEEFKSDILWEVEKTNIWKLVTAVKNILNYENYKEIPDLDIIPDNINFNDRKKEILDIIDKLTMVKFDSIFSIDNSREKNIASLLIILELVKDSIIDFSYRDNNIISFFKRS